MAKSKSQSLVKRAKGITKKQRQKLRSVGRSKSTSIKQPTLTPKEQRAIDEGFGVVAVEPTIRGFKYTAADPRAAQILLDLTRKNIETRNKAITKRQKTAFQKAMKSKTAVTEKGLAQVFKQQKRIIG